MYTGLKHMRVSTFFGGKLGLSQTDSTTQTCKRSLMHNDTITHTMSVSKHTHTPSSIHCWHDNDSFSADQCYRHVIGGSSGEAQPTQHIEVHISEVIKSAKRIIGTNLSPMTPLYIECCKKAQSILKTPNTQLTHCWGPDTNTTVWDTVHV